MYERGFYCEGMSAEFRRSHHIPEGFCGICDRCGKPGHTRHFPGALPYTGTWCDHCYHIVAWTGPFRTPLGWVQLAVFAGIIYAAFRWFSH